MIKLLKKYGVELKLKKCDLFRLIEGQKDTFLEDGFAFKMTNEEEMFKVGMEIYFKELIHMHLTNYEQTLENFRNQRKLQLDIPTQTNK